MLKTYASGISRNTLINIIGAIIPVIISLLTIAPYLHLIGDARYGVLAIVWLLVGYFGIFNMGLGRAATNQIARQYDVHSLEIKDIFWTSILLNIVLGIIGGVILLLVGHVLFGSLIKIPSSLRSDVLTVLPWLAAAVLISTIQAVLTGSLEGREHFLTVNILGVAEITLSQVVPLAIAYWHGPDLIWLISFIVLAKFFVVFAALIACFVHLPIRGKPVFSIGWVLPLFRYGSWITVSGIVGPVLTSLDQFLIGIQLGVQSVTYYSIPYNLVTRISLLPSSLSRTLFPRFSRLENKDAHEVGTDSSLILAVLITPVIVIGIVILSPFLELWLGPSISHTSAPIGEILALGVWFNCLAFIPYTFLQAQDRPDIPAKFHMLELLPYLIALWLGLKLAGLTGVAWAWTLRVIVDAVLLYVFSHSSWKQFKILVPAIILVTFSCICALTIFTNSGWRIFLGAFFIVLSLLWSVLIGSRLLKVLGYFPRKVINAIAITGEDNL
jgi:O-antigen/teichoic acid export membrane protein